MNRENTLKIRGGVEKRNVPKRPTRRAIEAASLQALHVARNSTKADVYKLEWPPGTGEFAVLKDMKNRPAWFRFLAGRWSIAREFRALQKLSGIAGVPRVIGRPDADCLLMEWRAGTPVMDLKVGQVPVPAINAIADIVAQSHARGVIHGDLHRSNVLVAPNGQVTLIDWATASVFKARRGAWKNFTFGEWRVLDIRAVAKLKARYAPESVSEFEKDALLNGSKIYRLIRTLGFKIRKVFGHKRAKSPEIAAERYKRFIERGQARSTMKETGDQA